MADTKLDQRLIIAVAVALVALLVGAGIGWFARSGEVADLEERLAEATLAAEEIPVTDLPPVEPAAEPASPAEPGTPAEPAPTAPAPAEPAPSTSSATTSREFCYVREVINETGTTIITVDYAQFLTGSEAAAAAAAAGDESPPPNDYYIVNENPLLRTFPVRAGISVKLTSTSDGVNPSGYTVVLGQWQDFFVGMSPGMERIRDMPYWITLQDGEVIAIEEQYLP